MLSQSSCPETWVQEPRKKKYFQEQSKTIIQRNLGEHFGEQQRTLETENVVDKKFTLYVRQYKLQKAG